MLTEWYRLIQFESRRTAGSFECFLGCLPFRRTGTDRLDVLGTSSFTWRRSLEWRRALLGSLSVADWIREFAPGPRVNRPPTRLPVLTPADWLQRRQGDEESALRSDARTPTDFCRVCQPSASAVPVLGGTSRGSNQCEMARWSPHCAPSPTVRGLALHPKFGGRVIDLLEPQGRARHLAKSINPISALGIGLPQSTPYRALSRLGA